MTVEPGTGPVVFGLACTSRFGRECVEVEDLRAGPGLVPGRLAVMDPAATHRARRRIAARRAVRLVPVAVGLGGGPEPDFECPIYD